MGNQDLTMYTQIGHKHMWRVCVYGIYPVTRLLRYMFKSTIQICTKETIGLPFQHEFCKGFLAETYHGCIVQFDAAGANLPNDRIPCMKMTIAFSTR